MNTKKLTLNKETLLSLTEAQTGKINVGAPPSYYSGCDVCWTEGRQKACFTKNDLC